jgi:cystathionine beta-lyase/cystathionine gamma-synthase
MSDSSSYRFGTRAIHAGQEPEPTTGAIMPPIFQTSTYVQPGLDVGWEWDYARTRHPTRETLERNLAALEGGEFGYAFASGLSALEALLKTFPGDAHIISEENTYGGVFRMFTRVLERRGLEFTWVDTRQPERVAAAMRPNTVLVHVETPTNPLMRIADIAALAQIAHAGGAILSVDNTFATPYNQTPLTLGADVVMHSTTKYLNGHSDMIGGALILNDKELGEALHFVRNSTGAVPGPMDCWLCLRATKTLHVRMARHNENGLAVAQFLEQHPAIDGVLYPGLPSHPQHALAAEQMGGFSGMVSVDVGSVERARKLVERTEVFALAESLGGVESLISVPALMTHASVPAARKEEMGLTEGLVRLSVGIEDIEDLIEDLEQALR